MIAVLLLLGCGEAPTSSAVQHDVGRLCVAWKQCAGVPCASYADEAGRMMSRWGRGVQPRLAEGDAAALSELSAMVVSAGVEGMSPTCAELRRAVR